MVLNDLVAADLVNHAAGRHGRDGLKSILRTFDVDFGPIEHWACRDDMALLEQLGPS